MNGESVKSVCCLPFLCRPAAFPAVPGSCSVQLRACLAGRGAGLATVPCGRPLLGSGASLGLWSIFTRIFWRPFPLTELGSQDGMEISEFVEVELPGLRGHLRLS